MRDYVDELERRLLLAGPSLTRETPQSHWRGRGSRRLAISLMVVVAGGAGGSAMSGVFAGRSETAWGAQLVRFANASPLVLLERAGWRVDYANEDSAQDGELHFTTDSVPSSPSAEDFTTDAQLNWCWSCRSGWLTARTQPTSRPPHRSEPQPTSTSTAEGVPDTRTSPRSGSTTAACSSSGREPPTSPH